MIINQDGKRITSGAGMKIIDTDGYGITIEITGIVHPTFNKLTKFKLVLSNVEIAELALAMENVR